MQYISIWPLYNVHSGKWTHIDFWQRLERREKFCWWLRTLVTFELDYLFLPPSLALTLKYYCYLPLLFSRKLCRLKILFLNRYLGRLKYSSEMNKTGLQTDVEALMIAPVLNSKKNILLSIHAHGSQNCLCQLPCVTWYVHAKSFRVDLWKYCSKLKKVLYSYVCIVL